MVQFWKRKGKDEYHCPLLNHCSGSTRRWNEKAEADKYDIYKHQSDLNGFALPALDLHEASKGFEWESHKLIHSIPSGLIKLLSFFWFHIDISFSNMGLYRYLSTAIPFYISANQALFQRILRAATFTSAVSSGLASQDYVKGDNACHQSLTERLEMRAIVMSFSSHSTTDWRARLQGLKWTRSALPLKGYADPGSAFSYVLLLFSKQSNGFLGFWFDFDRPVSRSLWGNWEGKFNMLCKLRRDP